MLKQIPKCHYSKLSKKKHAEILINAKKTGQQMQTYQAMCCNRCKNIALCWGKKHEDMFEILLFAEAHDKILLSSNSLKGLI